MKYFVVRSTSIRCCLLFALWVTSAYPNVAAAGELPLPTAPPAEGFRYPAAPAASITEVIERLDTIVALAQARGDRVGYFAALYRQITREVLRGIQNGAFDDGSRMDRFDTLFANRYFAALDTWQAGGATPASWRQTFELTRKDDTVIAQHIFSALAAHVAYDLPIAAAEIAPGRAIHALRPDYERINDILIDVLDAIQGAMNEMSPHLGLLDELAGDLDEGLFGVSVVAARGQAWEDALALARAPALFVPVLECLLDANAAALETLISRPVRPLYRLVQQIRVTEEPDVSTVIERLNTAIP